MTLAYNEAIQTDPIVTEKISSQESIVTEDGMHMATLLFYRLGLPSIMLHIAITFKALHIRFLNVVWHSH